jgi:hypothetical protein
MKQILAVALLLLSFTSAALAEGSGQSPPVQTNAGQPPAKP